METEERYDHKTVEAKCRRAWLQSKLDVADIVSGEKPFYNLMMFPYPSAEGLHVGNMYAFTGSDVYGRFKRMQGHDVFEPIGLDGFGIHSENYAFKIGWHPLDHAQKTEERFYDQLHKIGAMYDWSRTVETYDPDYYRFTQWLFVQMFKHGLAYRGRASVNWCPSDKTVLADEQVIDGRCERCGNIVEKKLLEQWFFRITAYAGKLLENIRKLDWSSKIKVAQINWIGKKEGINIAYPVADEAGNIMGELTCFTTRPDTNFGATFVVIAPEHPFVTRLLQVIKNKRRVETRSYVTMAKLRGEQERIAQGRQKTGVFTGLYCVNQLNHYKMPLYISDFVLMNVGTGAVVGVPGHDKRDFEFAKAFKLPIIRVVAGVDGDLSPISKIEQVQEEEGKMVNSDFLNGLDIREAIDKMLDYLEEKGWGKRVTTYHLRDWLISRQRYWGPPIPMIYCERCAEEGKSWFTTKEARAYRDSSFDSSRQGPDQFGVHYDLPAKAMTGLEKTRRAARLSTLDNSGREAAGWPASNALRSNAGWYPVFEDQLPVILPRIPDYKPGDDGVAPLAKHKEFYETTCPGCGAKAVRETDVSDTFLDSSWYFLRYPSMGDRSGKSFFGDVRQPQSQSSNVAPSSLNEAPHMPEQPISNEKSGRGFSAPQNASPRARRAPAPQENLPWDPAITKKWLPVDMYTGGAEHSVLHLMYSRFVWKALRDWGYLDFSAKDGPTSGWEEPFTRFFAHGLVIKDGAKMSKSKGNVVNPDEYIDQYGADALRLYLMFMGPFDQGGDFRDTAMEGMHRWVNRVWRLITAQIPNPKSQVSNGSTLLTTPSLSRDRSKIPASPARLPVGQAGRQNSKPEIKQALHRLIKKVTEDIEKRRYNTAIAAMMEFTNLVADQGGLLDASSLKTFILILAPFAPFLAEELWQRVEGRGETATFFGDVRRPQSQSSNIAPPSLSEAPHIEKQHFRGKKSGRGFSAPQNGQSHPSGWSVHFQPWPSFDPKQVAQESVKIIVQVNGKLRDALEVKSQKSKVKSEVESQARTSEKIRKFLLGRQVQKVIFVPGRLINFVVS